MTDFNVADFLKENVEAVIETKEVTIDRFKVPFTIKTITEADNAALRKRATVTKRGRNGQVSVETDTDKYAALLVIAATVVPDFSNVELQANYGTATAEDTVKTMLRAGEFANLAQAVSEFNGFTEDINDDVEEAKN